MPLTGLPALHSQPLNGKPVAIMGASTGNFGTLRAQLHLRQILTHVGALTLPKPEVLVARAGQAFAPDGDLVDEAARGFLRDLLVALADWTRAHHLCRFTDKR